MRKHLVFLLSAPMGSFGSYAGHERRGTGLVPLRSAMLGLVGAALGLDRADASGQSALQAYSVAVQAFQASTPLRDFHTAQSVPTSKVKRPATRKYALAKAGNGTNTIITFRDYRCDVLIGVALWGEGQWTLDDLSMCLRSPRFPLFVGRKSCPLASPLNSRVLLAESPAKALAQIDVPEWLQRRGWSEQERKRNPVYSDPVEGLAAPDMIEQVPGQPIDRLAWTFADRDVWILSGCQSEKENET